MNVPVNLPDLTESLFESIRPGRTRDELGKIGEAIYKLSDEIEKKWPNEMIHVGATPSEKYAAVLVCYAKSHDEESFELRHLEALNFLSQLAQY